MIPVKCPKCKTKQTYQPHSEIITKYACFTCIKCKKKNRTKSNRIRL